MLSKATLYHALIPLVFVFLWSTGFIGTKYGLPYADPLTFLFVRILLAAALLYVLISLTRSDWRVAAVDILHASIVGVLIHACYLGGVFVAISRGTDAGFAALIVSLQPLLTVVLAFVWLDESIGARKIAGSALGLAGVSLVILGNGTKSSDIIQNGNPMSSEGLMLCVMSLVAISVGTTYQKRFCAHISLLPSVCIQYVAAATILLPIAVATESMSIVWTHEFALALLWLVLALSLGAVLLLMWLIKRGDAGNVASLFYLVPPFTALQAWLFFGESLSTTSILGVTLSTVGIAIVLSNSRGRN